MAKYKITNIDEAAGHISFDIIVGGKVVLSDKRGDLPVDDMGAVKAELERVTLLHEADVKAARKTDTKLTALLGKEQNVVAPVDETPVAPSEV